MNDNRDVFLVLDDREDDREDGRHWGVGVYFADDPSEVQLRVHSETEELALKNAKILAEMQGWNVVDGPEEFQIP